MPPFEVSPLPTSVNLPVIPHTPAPSSPGEDTRLRFSIDPSAGKRGFRQWLDAIQAIVKLPCGIPNELRRKVWCCLASQYIKTLKLDWEHTLKYTFNDRCNPDDEKLGVQIVKDLHRTGYSGFSGADNEADRVLLKRVLLAYARWNKSVGYCQGFNVIAALLLEVCQGDESDTLKLMIYLVDRVLPPGYFSHNLRGLVVDMAVFRELSDTHLPRLSAHFKKLQKNADVAGNGLASSKEPPLTNVFTMQWFLTLFATCLPQQTVLRVWDCILFDGSEMLLRIALVLWGVLEDRIQSVESADEFYSVMATVTKEMLADEIVDCESIIQKVYAMGPLPNLTELREKYTYNITPFSPQRSSTNTQILSDDDDEEDKSMSCIPGFRLSTSSRSKLEEAVDISSECSTPSLPAATRERMSTDINALQRRYSRMKQRMQQVHVIYYGAKTNSVERPPEVVNPIETRVAINHLFLMREGSPKHQLQLPNRTSKPVNHLAIKPHISLQHAEEERAIRRQSFTSSSSDSRKSSLSAKSTEDSSQTSERKCTPKYLSTTLKPNIRPNLGSNDRPRIYNPFPVSHTRSSPLCNPKPDKK